MEQHVILKLFIICSIIIQQASPSSSNNSNSKKAKTSYAVGKATKEFSWSTNDDEGQNVMLSESEKKSRQQKREAIKRKKSHKKRSSSGKSSKKDYFRLLKKIRSVERGLDQINKALITGLTHNNERVLKVEMRQNMLGNEIARIETDMYELKGTYGSISNTLDSFDDEYSLYGNGRGGVVESNMKISDIVPIDDGMDLEEDYDEDSYRRRRFTNNIELIDRHFGFKNIDCTESQIDLIIGDNLQKRFSRLMIQIAVPVKEGNPSPTVQLLANHYLKATADSTYPQATYVTSSMHTTLQLYVHPGKMNCTEPIKLTATAL